MIAPCSSIFYHSSSLLILTTYSRSRISDPRSSPAFVIVDLGSIISNKSMFLSWAVIHVTFIIKCSWHITYWITKTIVLWIDKHYRIYETAQTWYENQYHTPSITSISTCYVPMWSMWPYQPIFLNNRKINYIILNIMWHFFTCFLAREKNVLVSETQYIKNVLNRLPLSSPLVTVV